MLFTYYPGIVPGKRWNTGLFGSVSVLTSLSGVWTLVGLLFGALSWMMGCSSSRAAIAASLQSLQSLAALLCPGFSKEGNKRGRPIDENWAHWGDRVAAA